MRLLFPILVTVVSLIVRTSMASGNNYGVVRADEENGESSDGHRPRIIHPYRHSNVYPVPEPIIPKPGIDFILEYIFIPQLLHYAPTAEVKKDVEDFQNHLKNGDFKDILEKTEMTPNASGLSLLQSMERNSRDSEYNGLIRRITKVGEEFLENRRAIEPS